jgi:hypothetical protein
MLHERSLCRADAASNALVRDERTEPLGDDVAGVCCWVGVNVGSPRGASELRLTPVGRPRRPAHEVLQGLAEDVGVGPGLGELQPDSPD